MDQVDAALDLLRRLPPQKITENLNLILELAPQLSEELSSAVDKPLQIATCDQTGKPFLLCDYNKEGESYRSPWSNAFQPPVTDPSFPCNNLRLLEIYANDVFDTYRQLYYGGGLSSVYMWDLEVGFAAVVLIKKSIEGEVIGSWDSIHVLEITERPKQARYRLTSTVILSMLTNGVPGQINLSGNLTRQSEQDYSVPDYNTHVLNMGRMIEDMETKLRNSLSEIYFGKTKDIANEMRSIQPIDERDQLNALQNQVVSGLASKS